MAVAAAIGAGVSIIGGAVAAGKAGKAARAAGRDRAAAEGQLNALKASRQQVTNPYDGVSDLSGKAKDLSSMVNNPFEQLGVATQAAEIQMEQSDIALANTLDTLRSTGASAGGATALAQAALQSKKGIAASIESQEAQNEKLKAQGEQQLNQQFQAQENRTNADLDRASGAISQASANQASANAAQAGAFGGMISAVGGIASSASAALIKKG